MKKTIYNLDNKELRELKKEFLKTPYSKRNKNNCAYCCIVTILTVFIYMICALYFPDCSIEEEVDAIIVCMLILMLNFVISNIIGFRRWLKTDKNINY